MKGFAAGPAAKLRAAIVTNIPAPYRVPVYALLAASPGIDLKLFFCSGREPDREWTLPPLDFAHEFLPQRMLAWRSRFIHFSAGVGRSLAAFAPGVVVTTGFNPTHLLACLYAHRHGAGHVAMTDGTMRSEARLGLLHRAARRRVYRHTQAFVGASEGSRALYRSYGIAEPLLFTSALCADNAAFEAASDNAGEREFDFIFCGRFASGKLPLFALDVAARASLRLGRRARLLMVGAGPLDADVRRAAARHAAAVDCVLPGFAAQNELPGHYARARLLLFPTTGDTWGVVANEACAAGLPVFVSPQAGAAGELVRDGDNGRVIDIDAQRWADAAAALLLDPAAWQRMSSRSRARVAPLTYVNAAAGLAAAILRAAPRP